MGAPAASFCPGAGSDWKAAMDQPGISYMSYVKALFTSKRWQNLVPDSAHSTLRAGYGTYGNPDYVTAGRSSDGTLVMAYLPEQPDGECGYEPVERWGSECAVVRPDERDLHRD